MPLMRPLQIEGGAYLDKFGEMKHPSLRVQVVHLAHAVPCGKKGCPPVALNAMEPHPSSGETSDCADARSRRLTVILVADRAVVHATTVVEVTSMERSWWQAATRGSAGLGSSGSGSLWLQSPTSWEMRPRSAPLVGSTLMMTLDRAAFAPLRLHSSA